ncbi:hypothetical protein KUD11_10030 [Roseovarius sp. LXJ103]|uniref:hypothetical protein n=1 Tax=Roseovarius carneus TaxID=2853164 RepID=UPI000D604C90|nr:hypothetical protein [Roseovarius carneus]MBZ8118984.1 hypothetical protein [Roseovarius carneus]PWE35363.1 hypothetical protein DD563_04925 [Pelagicola sp. LXJ1103]
MKQILTAAALVLCTALPLAAEEVPQGTDDAPSLMEQGAQMFMEGLLNQVEPTMRDLQGMTEDMGPQLREFAQTMGPAIAEIMGDIKDLSAYHAPELLPNGDIIMRRKSEEEMAPPPPLAEGEIEL